MRLRKIAILLVAVGFVGWVFYALSTTEPVRVIETSLQHENGQVFVTGKLQNMGPDVGPIDIEVRYYDNAGHPAGQDKVVVDKLGTSQIASFHTPKRDLNQITTFSVYMNHGRNPYGN
jgi:hypothetical protein